MSKFPGNAQEVAQFDSGLCMDVVAVEGMSLPGIRLRNRPAQVMPNQKKIKARRKRRKELVLIQTCLFGGLLLVVKGFSYLAENSGEDLAICKPPIESRQLDAEEGEQHSPAAAVRCLWHMFPLPV